MAERGKVVLTPGTANIAPAAGGNLISFNNKDQNKKDRFSDGAPVFFDRDPAREGWAINVKSASAIAGLARSVLPAASTTRAARHILMLHQFSAAVTHGLGASPDPAELTGLQRDLAGTLSAIVVAEGRIGAARMRCVLYDCDDTP